MAIELSPKSSPKLFEGDGGSYHSWLTSDLPLLNEAKVGAGKLILKPLGFALPHYADCAKVGYVLQGEGMTGLVNPRDPKENIVRLKKGDIIQVPLGVVSWWYNDNKDSDLSIVFLGEASAALNPGTFTYFLLTGNAGMFTGFSPEFTEKAFNVSESQARELFGSQCEVLIIKLQESLPGINPGMCKEEEGIVSESVKLDCNAIWSPRFLSEPTVQVVYVTRGSGRLQIVGEQGKRVLDAEVKEGELFVVPRFFVASVIAGCEGVQWFSITMSTHPGYGILAGERSILRAISPQVLGVSMNVNQELVKILKLGDVA